LNPVVSNSTNPLYLNVYLAGENVKVGIPNVENLVNEQFVLTSGEGVVAPVNTSNPVFAPDDDFYKHFFGEDGPHSIKEICNRASMVMYINEPDSRSGNTLEWFITGKINPPYINDYANGLGISSGILNHVAAAYVGYKGSVNFHFYPDNFNGFTPTGDVLATYVGYYEGGAWGQYNAEEHEGLLPFNFGTSFGFATIYSKVQNYLQFKFPYYWRSYYVPTFPVERAGLGNNCQHEFRVRNSVFASTNAGLNTDNKPIFASGGDDLNFVFFRGLPVFTIT